jgi:hypothetical protein
LVCQPSSEQFFEEKTAVLTAVVTVCDADVEVIVAVVVVTCSVTVVTV